MIWKKITIDTNEEASDIVAGVIYDNGIVGVEIEDNKNLTDEELSKMYVDIPKFKVDDGKAKVSFYVSIGNRDVKSFDGVDKNLIDNSYMMSSENIFTEDEFNEKLANIKTELEEYREFTNMGELKFSEIELDDKVFLNKWKENFKSITIDSVNIIPYFERDKSFEGTNIYIEPGNAFGTGQHITTKLCIRELKKYITERNTTRVLDIGCGSGILSILSKVLGADTVYAIDVDENVELNLKDNLQLNNIQNVAKITESSINASSNNDSFIYGFGNVLTDKWLIDELRGEKFDLIVANILAPVIISLIEKGNIFSYVKEGGVVVFSGILIEKSKDVLKTISSHTEVKETIVNKEDEWCSITCLL